MKTMRLVVVLFASLWSTFVFGQDEKTLLRQLIADERETVDALVLYPEETRIAILEACLHPEALVKISRIQENTQASFRTLVTEYPRDVQEAVWEMSRYPDLIARIVDNNANARPILGTLAEEYPDEMRSVIVDMGLQHFQLLASAHDLDMQAKVAVEAILQDYPEKTKDAFHALIALPEVLTLLTGNIELAVLSGDAYRKDPEWVLHKADSLNLVVAQDNARELQEWKDQLESDPDATKELQESADEFASEYEYDDQYYNTDDVYGAPGPDVVVVHHYDYYYPYWYGYPYWYDYPRWRPYPYWWDWGFYIAPNHTFVVINLPSFYFTHWYFFRNYHHYRYPHLSACFVRHYYYHPRPASSITVSVDQWKRSNRDVITDDWLNADGKQAVRVERLREFGEFERDREKYNSTRPEKQLTQTQFLEKYPTRYEEIRPVAKVPADVRTVPATPPQKVTPAPGTVPRNTEKVDKKAEDVRKTPSKPTERVEPKKENTEPKKDVPPKQDQPEMEKAKAYHRNTWENTKRVPEKTPPPKAPAKTAPTKTAPAKQAPPAKRNNGK